MRNCWGRGSIPGGGTDLVSHVAQLKTKNKRISIKADIFTKFLENDILRKRNMLNSADFIFLCSKEKK